MKVKYETGELTMTELLSHYQNYLSSIAGVHQAKHELIRNHLDYLFMKRGRVDKDLLARY